MTYDLTFENIAASLRRKKSNSCYDLLVYNGWTLKYINSGVYRNVYQIEGSQFLVKVPITAKGMKVSSIAHARAEYATYRRILRSKVKYAELKQLMPTQMLIVPNGLIVVEKLRKLGRVTREERKYLNQVGNLASSLFGGCGDLHDDNFMRDSEGNIKIVDLGFLMKNKPFRQALRKPKVKKVSIPPSTGGGGKV